MIVIVKIIAKQKNMLYELYLFFISLGVFTTSMGISSSLLEFIHNICLVVSIFFAVCALCVEKQKFSFFILEIVALLIGVISYLISKNTDFLYTILTILLIRKIPIDCVLKVIFNIRMIMFFIVVGTSLVGLSPIGTIAKTSAEKGALLGFQHANVFAGSVGILILLYLAINRENLTAMKLFIVTVIVLVVYLVSHTRIFFVLMLMTLFLMTRKGKHSFKIFKWILPVMIVLNIVLIGMRITNIGVNIVDKIDVLFNGRMLLSQMNLKYYPITLMGQYVDINIIASENKYYALDNGYIYLLINYGVLGLVLFCWFIQTAMRNCIKQKDYVLCVITSVFMVWIVYEGMMASAPANFALLFAFADMNKQVNERKGEQNDT